MKLLVLLLVCLTLGSQGRVLLEPKEFIDIPVEILQEKEPQALPLIAEKEKELEKEAVKELEKEVEKEKELETEAKTQLPVEPQPEIKTEEVKIDIPAEIKTELPKAAEEQPTEAQAEPQTESQIILKSLPVEEVPAAAAAVEPVAVAAVPAVEEQDAVQPNLRQATQATPTQQQATTTQQNFVQQLIQNSPIGQFLNQFNGNQPQQQQQVQPLADQPTTPAPTLPGFLNPSNAITTVQNAAQSVVNGTTQAFQGIQQFASNLGTQFQNTLSGLTGQQQQQQQVTTPRPPGPIQSFVNNVFGGGNNATAAAAAAPPQQQGPLQGIINFLGGNRPQNPAPAPAVVTQAPPKPAVDDKIEESSDDLAEQPADTENEVRNSAEAIDDSFEEAVPTNEVIVVNDDASASGSDVATLPDIVESVPSNSVEPAAVEAVPAAPAAVAAR